MVEIPEHAVKAAIEAIDDYYDAPECVGEAPMKAALTAAAHMSGVTVKQLVWSDVCEPNENNRYTHITAYSPIGIWSIEWKAWKDYDDKTIFLDGDFIGNGGDNLEAAKAAAQADYEKRILSALEPSPACEKAWYFNAGDAVPEWLKRIEGGDACVTFGVNVVVTSRGGGYEIRPQSSIDNDGPFIKVTAKVTGDFLDMKGGGTGVNFIFHNKPYPPREQALDLSVLQRMAEKAEEFDHPDDLGPYPDIQDAMITVGDLRKLRKLLTAIRALKSQPAPQTGGSDE